jgi:hypothetical protein
MTVLASSLLLNLELLSVVPHRAAPYSLVANVATSAANAASTLARCQQTPRSAMVQRYHVNMTCRNGELRNALIVTYSS